MKAFLVGAACMAAGAASAAPIELVPNTINMFRDTRGINDVGIAQGDRFQFGASIVSGSAGASLGALYPPTGFNVAPFPCNPLTVDANFCSRTTAYSSNRLDPWTFRFTRGTDVLDVAGPSMQPSGGQDIRNGVPFPVSVTITGSGQTPTISWEIPGGSLPDGFRINIFDKGKILPSGQADVIRNAVLAPNATSWTVPAGVLQEGGNYSINFQLIETRGHVAFTGNNAEILKRSSSFFAFTPLTGNGPPNVHLPQVGVDTNPNDNLGAVYQFNVTNVGPNSVTFIDPFVAVGYDYATGQGDPNFASVVLPEIGDDEFLLSFLLNNVEVDEIIHAGEQFFFPQGGVDAFKVRGIETEAGLDPEDVTAFVTGLTFVAPGDFTGTMTPILVFVPDQAIPEPGTLALLGAGLGMLALTRRRRASSARRK